MLLYEDKDSVNACTYDAFASQTPNVLRNVPTEVGVKCAKMTEGNAHLSHAFVGHC